MSYERKAQKLDLQSKQLAVQKSQKELNDPMTQMMGFVNMLNALQNPMIAQQQFGQEMGLKQQQLQQENAWRNMQAQLGEREMMQKGELGRGQFDETKRYHESMLGVEQERNRRMKEAADYERNVSNPWKMWTDVIGAMMEYSRQQEGRGVNPAALQQMSPPNPAMQGGWSSFFNPPKPQQQGNQTFPFPIQ